MSELNDLLAAAAEYGVTVTPSAGRVILVSERGWIVDVVASHEADGQPFSAAHIGSACRAVVTAVLRRTVPVASVPLAPWLTVPQHEAFCRARDAVIDAVAARFAPLGVDGGDVWSWYGDVLYFTTPASRALRCGA